jgi:hypothetical protein
MKTLITLLVACSSSLAFAFTKAPAKPVVELKPISQTKPYEFVSDKTKTCVYAPLAKTELEKRSVLTAAANDFLLKNRDTNVRELCLAFIKPEAPLNQINAYTSGSAIETLEPGKIAWTSAADAPVIEITHGFEREDAGTYIDALVRAVNGKACVKKASKKCTPDFKKALKLVHDELKVNEHPLDWILAP